MPAELIPTDDIYIWTDLETTGLDPERDCILELAAIATDGMLQELGEFHTLVAPFPESLEQMGDFVRDMHTKNDLLYALSHCDPPTAETAGHNFANWMRKLGPGNKYLAGNSIHAVDWPFTHMYMPQIHMNCKSLINGQMVPGPLHYRALDVTSVRLALKVWTGYDFTTEKVKTHRALGDVRECIAELKYLRSCTADFFQGPSKI